MKVNSLIINFLFFFYRMIRTKQNYNWREALEVARDWGPSKTIPDQTMSLRTILNRYANGQPASGIVNDNYTGDDADGVNVSKMDLADRESYFKEKMAELSQLKQSISEKQKAYTEQQNAKFKDMQKQIEELKALQKGTNPLD